MKHKTHTNQKIVKTRHYKRAYVTVTAVLIIFCLILQTVINLRMLSIVEDGGTVVAYKLIKCIALVLLTNITLLASKSVV